MPCTASTRAKSIGTKDAFFATGEANVRDQILPELAEICQGREPAGMRVLEIGCGVGPDDSRPGWASSARSTESMSVRKWVRRAREHLRSTPNAHVHCNSGTDLQVLGDLEFDFAHSFIVFQHIPSRDVIDRYVGEVSQRLSGGSLFKFQVQGHHGRGMRKPGRDTWLGASISEPEATQMATRHGFDLLRSAGAGTQYFWLWLPEAIAKWRWVGPSLRPVDRQARGPGPSRRRIRYGRRASSRLIFP